MPTMATNVRIRSESVWRGPPNRILQEGAYYNVNIGGFSQTKEAEGCFRVEMLLLRV
jgi:hypothetical protein